MRLLGERVGRLCTGGEVIELIGDVGAGKTTFTKGLGLGLGIDEDVQSPSFTVSRVYDARDNLQMMHYDFYRLHDAGIMSHELQEAFEGHGVVVIEWSDIVAGILPEQRLQLHITPLSESERSVELIAQGGQYEKILEGMK